MYQYGYQGIQEIAHIYIEYLLKGGVEFIGENAVCQINHSYSFRSLSYRVISTDKEIEERLCYNMNIKFYISAAVFVFIFPVMIATFLYIVLVVIALKKGGTIPRMRMSRPISPSSLGRYEDCALIFFTSNLKPHISEAKTFWRKIFSAQTQNFGSFVRQNFV